MADMDAGGKKNHAVPAPGEIADKIFNSINMLTIRKTVRVLCGLTSQEIEEFGKKYSNVIIYLLNIVDKKLATELLGKLTDSSLQYIIEAECHNLLLKMISHAEGELDTLVDLNNFMELVANPEGTGLVIDPGSGRVLQLIWQARLKEGKAQFAYLDTISAERRYVLNLLLIKHNIHALLIVLLYASQHVAFELLDLATQSHPELLDFLPLNYVRMRLEHYDPMYRQPEIMQHLPKVLQQTLKETEAIYAKFEKEFDKIHDLQHSTEVAAERKREEILNIIYVILQQLDVSFQNILLTDLESRGAITEDDIYMLKSVSDTFR